MLVELKGPKRRVMSILRGGLLKNNLELTLECGHPVLRRIRYRKGNTFFGLRGPVQDPDPKWAYCETCYEEWGNKLK